MHLVPLALTIGGGLIKAAGQSNAGTQSRNVLYQQASEAEKVGSAEELRIREAAGKVIGQQRAAQAGNGFAGDSGSALDALRESQINLALDVLQLRRDAAARARSLREEGDMRRTEGRMGAVATLFESAAAAWQMKGDWAAARQAFGPSQAFTTRGAMGAGMSRYGYSYPAPRPDDPMRGG